MAMPSETNPNQNIDGSQVGEDAILNQVGQGLTSVFQDITGPNASSPKSTTTCTFCLPQPDRHHYSGSGFDDRPSVDLQLNTATLDRQRSGFTEPP